MFTKTDFIDSIEQFYSDLLNGLDVTDDTVTIANSYIKKDYFFVKLILDSLIIDFTVGYHEIFLAPVLYFRVFNRTRPVLDYDQLIPLCSIDTKVPINIDLHHIFNDPWWWIHPCETKEYMHQFDVESSQYLKLWWSIYGLSGLFTNIRLNAMELKE